MWEHGHDFHPTGEQRSQYWRNDAGREQALSGAPAAALGIVVSAEMAGEARQHKEGENGFREDLHVPIDRWYGWCQMSAI